MCDTESASDDLSEEKDEATLPPWLRGNPHLVLNKYINKKKSLTQLLQTYTILSETEIWSQMFSTVAWRTELKGESCFQRDEALRRSQWFSTVSWGQVMADKHGSFWVKSFFLALQLLQSKCLSKSTTLAPEIVIAQDLSDLVLFYETKEVEKISVKQRDSCFKNDSWEKKSNFFPGLYSHQWIAVAKEGHR